MVSIEDQFRDADHRMTGAIDAVRKDLLAIRTGRASTGLVDHVPVDYHGTIIPINQLSSVTAPEARMIVIQPWDQTTIGDIEKAIQKTDLGLTPNNDGTVIRLVLPIITEERRKDLLKLVRKRIEDGKVAVRNVRRDINEKLKDQEKAKTLSQDELRRAQDRIQKLTDSCISQIEQTGRSKEQEVMEE